MPPTHFRLKPEVTGFKEFKQTKSSSRVEIGIIRHAEFSETISFEIHPCTSGLNRKLPVFSGFKQKRSNVGVKIEVIRHAECNETINFETRPRTSGLNPKLSVFS